MLAAACLGARAQYVVGPRFAVKAPTGSDGGAGEGDDSEEEGGRHGRC